jgi:hypothetical protein
MHLPLHPLGRNPFLRTEQESDRTSCRRTVAYLSFLPEISPTFSGLWRELEVVYCGDTGLLGVRILPGTGSGLLWRHWTAGSENTARNHRQEEYEPQNLHSAEWSSVAL